MPAAAPQPAAALAARAPASPPASSVVSAVSAPAVLSTRTTRPALAPPALEVASVPTSVAEHEAPVRSCLSPQTGVCWFNIRGRGRFVCVCVGVCVLIVCVLVPLQHQVWMLGVCARPGKPLQAVASCFAGERCGSLRVFGLFQSPFEAQAGARHEAQSVEAPEASLMQIPSTIVGGDFLPM